MSNFIENCINGDALSFEIDNYIDEWHKSDSKLKIYEYLGMTKLEYELFVEDESYLGVIINSHIENVGINEVVESLAMAARSDGQAKSNRLERWLKDEGLWD
jgi:hypothetical protein